jgi:LAO/AO transport system kinase
MPKGTMASCHSDLVDRMLAGDRLALARLITLVENRAAASPSVMSRVYARCGRAYVIGITGPPGAGKSTLTSVLVGHARREQRTVGVIAVDPSSPFSGGAVLGDRIRMQTHFLDPGVFIRSLSSRGSHGGVARSTRDLARLLDAFGFDLIIVETVGVGQTELDIMGLADTTIVVLVPEAGDTIQVMKAGLLEIADVFVVNKADREGAERMKTELEAMLHLRGPVPWSIPVVATEAARERGTEAVWKAIGAHRAYREAVGVRVREGGDRRAGELLDILDEELRRRMRDVLARPHANGLARVVEAVRKGALDPYAAALQILGDEERFAALIGSTDGTVGPERKP